MRASAQRSLILQFVPLSTKYVYDLDVCGTWIIFAFFNLNEPKTPKSKTFEQITLLQVYRYGTLHNLSVSSAKCIQPQTIWHRNKKAWTFMFASEIYARN